MPLVRYIGVEGLERAPAADAAEIIAHGGVIIYPTETLYGIGADATDESAVCRINEIKRRPAEESQIVLLRWEWLSEFVADYQRLLPLLESFAPGPLTVIAAAVPRKLASALTPNGKLAFRISSAWFVESVLEISGKPITSTSVNFFGEEFFTKPQEILEKFWDTIDGMFLMQDVALEGPPSTIIDASDFPERIIIVREGAISEAAIRKSYQ